MPSSWEDHVAAGSRNSPSFPSPPTDHPRLLEYGFSPCHRTPMAMAHPPRCLILSGMLISDSSRWIFFLFVRYLHSLLPCSVSKWHRLAQFRRASKHLSFVCQDNQKNDCDWLVRVKCDTITEHGQRQQPYQPQQQRREEEPGHHCDCCCCRCCFCLFV